jgi:hypothetical protein
MGYGNTAMLEWAEELEVWSPTGDWLTLSSTSHHRGHPKIYPIVGDVSNRVLPGGPAATPELASRGHAIAILAGEESSIIAVGASTSIDPSPHRVDSVVLLLLAASTGRYLWRRLAEPQVRICHPLTWISSSCRRRCSGMRTGQPGIDDVLPARSHIREQLISDVVETFVLSKQPPAAWWESISNPNKPSMLTVCCSRSDSVSGAVRAYLGAGSYLLVPKTRRRRRQQQGFDFS